MRRVHVSHVRPGRLALSDGEARHVRDVLRLTPGTKVEGFDDAGGLADATITKVTGDGVWVEIVADTDAGDTARPAVQPAAAFWVASAVPKGDRADWLVEKLSELGVAAWRPLRTERSVVHPDGVAKYDRWSRLAVESAKQCRRSGVMRVAPIVRLHDALRAGDFAGGVFGSTRAAVGDVSDPPPAAPPAAAAHTVRRTAACSINWAAVPGVCIGPEGGWTDDEEVRFVAADLTPVRLTATILRVETAAVAAAVLALSARAFTSPE